MKNAVKTSVIMLALAFSFAAHAQVDPTLDRELEEGKIEANEANMTAQTSDARIKAVFDQIEGISANLQGEQGQAMAADGFQTIAHEALQVAGEAEFVKSSLGTDKSESNYKSVQDTLNTDLAKVQALQAAANRQN